ncbi:MAG: hypothetical protein PHG02_07910 [Oscillospiraceae bacterium]|nr:hypothetical protein [Oscillospiraceae bacterium]
MNENEKQTYFTSYNNHTHLLGRIGLTIGLVMLLAAPFAMGAVLGEMPDFAAFAQGFAQIAIVYIPSCIVEFLIYAPMLGAGASYLAFITGNLINLKIPCAVNARDIAKAEAGTPENEIISTLSVATSSLVTIVVIALGVLMLVPLQPVLSNPILQPAFNNVVPALFGALAYKYFRKGIKIVAFPLLAMTALCVFVPSAISSVGFLIVPSGAIAIGIAWILFKKNKI